MLLMLGHAHDKEVVSQRYFGCGMGVSAALFVPDARGCAAARSFVAGVVQRPALRGQDRLSVAVSAPRLPTVDRRLSAGAAVVPGGGIRDHRSRFAGGSPV